jgi:dTDP-4-dehydrorhamnose 3,5-epimerase|tara:strand:- start:870 stop:1436 length:567 start_codon:yes stop_codon:yes gene_type:complete
MQISIEKTEIEGLNIVMPEIFRDERGFFSEVYRKDQFDLLGLPSEFVQLNHSASTKSVLRGLHFQWEPPMGKLMRVTIGSAYLVAVDIRKNSPTIGKSLGFEVSAENGLNIWAPAGFARGFCVLSDYAEIQYLCTGIYNGLCESGILWNDPELGIEWPVSNPILSAKDDEAQTLQDWLKREESDSFKY